MGHVVECLWLTERTPFTPGPWHAVWLELNSGLLPETLEMFDRLRRETELPLLLHMLSEETKDSLDIWHQYGIDAIILPWHPSLSPETLRAVRDAGCLCGLSLVPGTRDWATMVRALWSLLDLVVVQDRGDVEAVGSVVRGLVAMRGDRERPLVGVKSSIAERDTGPLDLLIYPAPIKSWRHDAPFTGNSVP